ncbi:MAG: aminotransferase class I/II-fold pyridoxal phosphate-dependent enzyme [Gemmatimonadota bacterium]
MIKPFAMERWQSHHENEVRYNLSDSGVHPLALEGLLELAGATPEILATPLSYGQTNGTPVLRERIAALYGSTAEQVVVTNGSAEANFLVAWEVVEPGDAVAVLTPTYGQLPGLAAALGARVRPIPLREDRGWQPDPTEARDLIDEGTRLVVVTNPQNPTGVRLDDTSITAVLSAAERVGAWVLADEVYAGAERDGVETPSLFGRYERVMATGSLSKAYGLQGLRIGWVVAPPDLAEPLWARKDYTTISPGLLTDTLAALALRADVRPRLLERTREIIRTGVAVVERWIDDVGHFRLAGHDAGGVCFPSYDLAIASLELAERLRREQDVLVVPGAHFGSGRYLRLGTGVPAMELEAALGRVAELVRTLPAR